MSNVFEIERRYLIRYPDLEKLDSLAEKTEIVQTYLFADVQWDTNRVRKRGGNGGYTFTHTRKKRISAIKRIEDEIEVSEEQYLELIKKSDPDFNVIHKFRYCLNYNSKVFEIDIFSFWDDRAIMELELEREDETFELPPFIEIIKEITSEGRYTNAALARDIPYEKI